jgi:hypothetical protein
VSSVTEKVITLSQDKVNLKLVIAFDDAYQSDVSEKLA